MQTLTGKHIYDFIDNLPGGNPQQYSRLLNISVVKISNFLKNNRMGKQLVKDGKVKASPRGTLPSWAIATTERGLLTADDVPSNHYMLKAACNSLPSQYQADVHHMMQMIVHLTSGNCGFEQIFSEITAPFILVSQLNEEHRARLEMYQSQISQLERIVELQERSISNTLLLTSSRETA